MVINYDDLDVSDNDYIQSTELFWVTYEGACPNSL